jgi:hypothetical protein
MEKRICYFATILGMIFLFSSCKCDRKELGITFVYDEPINETTTNYPSYFKEIAIPYMVECPEKCIDFLPKPINVSRIDISKREIKTTAWYFESIGDNTIDFSTTWLGQYFNDSLPPPYLLKPKGNKASIESFLKKNQQNSFIYSEESDLKEYLGIKVFNTTNKLVEELKANACQNEVGKFYVLVNPKMKHDNKEEDPVQNPSSEEITSIFNKLGERNTSPEVRFNLIEGNLNKFSSGANVKEFGKNGTLVGLSPIREYFEKIAFYKTLESIEITDALKNPDGKFWEIRLVEHHLNDPK